MQFVAELKDYSPCMWRRFQIGSNVKLEKFCYTLMGLFRMSGGHLFEFNMRGCRYALPMVDADGWDEPAKSMSVVINKLFTRKGSSGELWYDFGDSWYVRVKLEKLVVEEVISPRELPRVLAGEGYGIVEDCGGVWGLAEIAKGLQTGQAEDWEDQKPWLEENYPEVLERGLEYFDIDEMNSGLNPKGRSDIYKLMSK